VAAASSKPSLVRKTAAVLRAVAAGGDGIGLSEVARAASVPKATCLRILNDLIDEQLVVLDPDSKRYAVGFGALSLVGGVLDAESAHVHIRHELRRLADVTGETSGLDILVGADVVVIAQVQGPSTIGYSPSGVPRTLETWNTSTGKVLLAQLDTKQLRKTHRAALDAVAAARGSRVAFLDELSAVHERGYGAARDEMEVGAAAVAAPVRVDGEVVAAAWIGGPSFRITPDRVPAIADEVIASAKVLGDILEVTGRRLDGGGADG
jgi:IclR family transcriptional regulator, acetate operon repressor